MNYLKKTVILILQVALLSLHVEAEGYRTSIGSGKDEIPVIVVKGTPYEMGYAFGALMKEEAQALFSNYLSKAQLLAPVRCSDATLDAAWKSVQPYTDQRHAEELRGIAHGADIPVETIIRVHMIPIIMSYSCSGVGVWDDMTEDGHCYLIRNLDFTKQGDLQDYPAIVVYHPDNGIAHANITFAGVAGCNTGINAAGVALAEKGASPEKDYPFDLNGTHFLPLFRSILYDAHDMDDALKEVNEAQLIKKYRFFFGDGKNHTAVKIKSYAPADPIIWEANDPSDENAPNIMPNTIYSTMNDSLAFELLQRSKGKFNAEQMIDLSRQVALKGESLMNVVYDCTALKAWVAYADKQKDASTQKYIEFNLNDYLPYNSEGQLQTITSRRSSDGD